VPNDAARLEAVGARAVEFYWRGRPVTIPLALEDWPLETIRVDRHLLAVDILLAGQYVGDNPLIDDYRDLSEAMAEACGAGRLPERAREPHEWFGGVPRLLRYLRDYEADIESDLRSRWRLEYADRWRLDDAGRPALTLRAIWTCIRRSLPTSALAVADNHGREVWTAQTFATARVWEALTGKPYEGRPFTEAEVAKAIQAMQQRAAEVAKLRSRRAHYHPEEHEQEPAPADPRLVGVYAAAQEAIANRRAEMGAPEANGNPTLN
jgi:hypothetical protein